MNEPLGVRPPVPRLYLVGARALFASDAAWLDALERAAAAVAPWLDPEFFETTSRGADTQEFVPVALQVRIEPDADATERAAAACARLRRANPMLPLYLNAAADAAELGYDGEHWAERRIPAAPPQPHAAPTAMPRLAASVHSTAALARAAQAGAGFAVFGAIWKPAWKDVPAHGLGALAAVARHASIPVLAIGGVTPARVRACRRAGAVGIAVASGVLGTPDVAAALGAYMSALRDG